VFPFPAWEKPVPQERSEAVVLRGVDFSETSRIVTLLCPARGRIACLAKGARRRQSPFGPTLDTFNRLEIVYYWKDGRSVQPLSEASLLDGYDGIKADLEKAAFAAFPLELASKAAHENNPSEELYAALVQGLDALEAWRGDVRTHVCWQVGRLLAAAGYEPALDACAHCGGTLGEHPGFLYDGGATCADCRPDRRLSAGDYAALCAVARERDACPDLTVSGVVFDLLRHYAARQLDGDFRSVRVIEQMFRA
jgi:DNA repair protein RecO (recombination protein O)